MASRGVNKVILVGNLGKNPEIRYTSTGNAITSIAIATSETWTDKKTSEKKEKTEWHRVILFGKLAEIAGEYLKKGSQVYIEGSLQTRKWTDPNGIERYTTEIIVNMNGTMKMLGGNRDNNLTKNENITENNNKMQDEIYNNNKKNDNPLIDFEDDIPF